MEIKTANNSDKQNWDNYVLNHPNSTPYHLFAWKEAVENAYGFKGLYLTAEKKNQIIGILPLIHLHLPMTNGALISLPYCDAAGTLSGSQEIEKTLYDFAIKIARSKNIKKLSLRSTNLIPGTKKESSTSDKVRMILTLPSNADTLMESFKSKLRSQVKKPLRDGLTSQIGGLELLNLFYPLFAENMRDLGSPVHTRKWIKSILEAYKNKAHLVLTTMPDGQPAAGGILLTTKKSVSVPWASSLRKYNRYNPNMLLYWTFLKYACDMNFSSFDFGRSTIGEGTYKFKKQWGAKPSPLFWADFDTEENRFIDSPKQNGINKNRDFLAAVIMKTPVSFNNALGKVTRKYISL